MHYICKMQTHLGSTQIVSFQASELSKAGMGCLPEVVSFHWCRGQAETPAGAMDAL